jgi:high-affinity iron transporter
VLAIFLIGIREGLEASLVVGILIAYLSKIGRRDVLPKLWVGVGAAIVISLAAGAILQFGPSTLSTQAQEIIGGSLSLLAVGLATWMVFWMARHSRGLSTELRSGMDAALDRGAGRAVIVLALVSVGREGLETALFIWASTNAGDSPALGLLCAVGGVLVAVGLAYAIMRGIVRVNLAVFFRRTGLLLVVVAAGVLAYGIRDLQEAGVVPGANVFAYNIAGVVSPTSWYGVVLTGIFNFSAEPTWGQFLGWWAYLAVVLPFWVVAQRPRREASAPLPAAESAR